MPSPTPTPTPTSSLRPVAGDADGVLALLREWDAAADPEPLVVATSGSTGRPKRVVLSRDALRASARATHERLGGPGQWVLGLPPTYVAGVQVLFRSVVAGTDPVRHDGDWVETVARLRGRGYVSLVPTQLVRLLRGAGTRSAVEALAQVDAVLVGGGPLDARVRAEAERRGVRVVQTYGMSETCGGCVYDGEPLDGVEVRVRDGEVQLRGPVLFDGYEDEPERSAAALDDGWLRTDDLGELDADGRLRVLGRADDVIISGGVNVPARAVATAVTADAAVVEAEVVGVPDEEWGELVTAVVEAREPVTLAGVRDLVEPRAWAPRRLVVLEQLPRLANGKPDRLAIRALAAREVARG
ncbi:AMP-binding protein [Nocardioides aurantiacus]|uniref:O-succinylbenzoic acid--CoA ligase n=1 Tax=Nocardioides aurantiacus TaxID=86796 RepID=A0A3N2CPQ9_9ACTN|nr:AMP-binding protein [Nocardioides aurantiacus]ROR89505.1 O-succinylbenzoic acid--CoA ligase [Nocardioides aurantiacus]